MKVNALMVIFVVVLNLFLQVSYGLVHDMNVTETINTIQQRMQEAEIQMTEMMTKLLENIHTLTERVEKLETRADDSEVEISEELGHIVHVMDVHAEDMTAFRRDLEAIRQQQDYHVEVTGVSFSAYADSGIQYPNEGEAIRFPLVLSNNGGHYNPEESVFTCPYNSTYFFMYSLYTSHLSSGELTSGLIQKEGEPMSESFCRNQGGDDLYTQCANSVVTHCYQGQRVFVTARYSDGQLSGVTTRTTFSGFIIHADIY